MFPHRQLERKKEEISFCRKWLVKGKFFSRTSQATKRRKQRGEREKTVEKIIKRTREEKGSWEKQNQKREIKGRLDMLLDM